MAGKKRVGIVLHSFQEVVSGVQRMLDPTNLAEFRKNVAALENRAIFEIPEILDKLLRESAGTQASSSAPRDVCSTCRRRRSTCG